MLYGNTCLSASQFPKGWAENQVSVLPIYTISISLSPSVVSLVSISKLQTPWGMDLTFQLVLSTTGRDWNLVLTTVWVVVQGLVGAPMEIWGSGYLEQTKVTKGTS